MRSPTRHFAAWFAAATLWVSLPLAAAAEAPPAVPAQVRALHTLADLDTNVRSFCLTLVESAGAELTNPGSALQTLFDADTRTRWMAAIEQSCVPESASERHLQAFAAGYDPESARAVTDWYTSEAGRHLLALEAAAASTDWEAEVVPFVDRITKEPVPVERVKLVDRIDAATGATEDAALLQAGIVSIQTMTSQALLPADQRAPTEQIDAQLELIRQSTVQQMRAQLSIIMLFMFQEASDEELAAYADFTESKPARWLFATHRMAMLQLIAEVREDAVRRLTP